jgi:hypothetical protein
VRLRVAFHVQREVIRAREAAVTMPALEGFGARVFPVVARQLVRTGEPPLTTFPRAAVRLFA